MTVEHDLGTGGTLIIEWSEFWGCYVGTLTNGAWHVGSFLRDSEQEVLEAGLQTVERKG